MSCVAESLSEFPGAAKDFHCTETFEGDYIVVVGLLIADRMEAFAIAFRFSALDPGLFTHSRALGS